MLFHKLLFCFVVCCYAVNGGLSDDAENCERCRSQTAANPCSGDWVCTSRGACENPNTRLEGIEICVFNDEPTSTTDSDITTTEATSTDPTPADPTATDPTPTDPTTTTQPEDPKDPNCGCTGAAPACTSRNSFAYCVGGAAIAEGNCPTDESCNIALYTSSKKICIPNAILEALDMKPTCDMESSTSETTPKTPTTGELQDVCQEAGNTSPYFYTGNKHDTSCRTYVYCEKVTNQLYETRLITCGESAKYFNKDTNQCQASKPKDCL